MQKNFYVRQSRIKIYSRYLLMKSCWQNGIKKCLLYSHKPVNICWDLKKNEVTCKNKSPKSWVNWNGQFRSGLPMVSSELDENVQALKNHIQTLLLVKCNFLVSRKILFNSHSYQCCSYLTRLIKIENQLFVRQWQKLHCQANPHFITFPVTPLTTSSILACITLVWSAGR